MAGTSPSQAGGYLWDFATKTYWNPYQEPLST